MSSAGSLIRSVKSAVSVVSPFKRGLLPKCIMPIGFNDTTVAELRKIIADFVAERDWSQFHSPKNVSMALAIEAAELMEHFQWLTTGRFSQARR